MSLDVIKNNQRQKYELIREYGSRGCAGGSLSGNRKAEYVLIEDALAAGKNVVVDDTNLTAEIRAVHVEHARMHGAEVHAVYFDNAVRAYRRNAARAAEKVPHHVVVMQRAALEPPEILDSRWKCDSGSRRRGGGGARRRQGGPSRINYLVNTF